MHFKNQTLPCIHVSRHFDRDKREIVTAGEIVCVNDMKRPPMVDLENWIMT